MRTETREGGTLPKSVESAKQWQKDLALRVGAAVAARRKELNLTASALAERTADLGYPVSRVAIGKIETGHREGKFDLAELMVLAAALSVPPVALVFPHLPDGDVELLPGRPPTSSADAMRWFSGESEAQSTDAERLIALTRKRFDIEHKRDQYQAWVEMNLAKGDEKRAADAILGLVDRAEEIKELNRQIATIPGAVVAAEQENVR